MKSVSVANGLPEQEGGLHTAAGASRSWVQRPMFWHPSYLAPSAWHEHIPFAFWIMQAHRPRMVVELGVHYGVSYFAFCQAVSRLGMDTSCYGIDTFKGDMHSGEYDGNVYEQVRKQNDAHYPGFSTILRSTFDEALGYFRNGSIDLLHIDGMHTFDAVRADFESWLPKLSPRAVVLMHDTNVRERGFGVARMFQDLCGRYPNFEFIHGHGLGILAVGKEQSDPMRQLFALSGNELERQMVREAFASLGQGCADAFRARENDKKAAGWMDQAEMRDKQLKYVQQCLEKSKADVDELNGRLMELSNATHAEREKLAHEKGNLEGKLELLDSIRLQLMDDLVQRNSGMHDAEAALQMNLLETEALKKANQEWELRKQGLESKLLDADVQRENMLNEKEKLEKAAESAAEEQERLNLAICELEQRNRDLSQTTVLFQAENSKLKTELVQIVEQVARSTRLAEEAELRFRNALQDLSSSNTRVKQLEQELNREKALAMQLKVELSAAGKKNLELEKEKALQISLLREETSRQLEELASENGRLSQELEQAHIQVKELIQELESKAAQPDNSEEIDSLTRQHAEQTKKLIDELEEHKTQLNDRFAELAELTRMLEEQGAALKNKDMHASVMTSSIDELKKRYEQAQEEIVALRNEVRAKTSSLEDRFREIAMLTQVVQQREAEVNSKNEELQFEKERAAHFRDLLEAQTSAEAGSETLPAKEPEVPQEETSGQKLRKRRARVSRLSVDTQISLLEKSDILDNDWYLEQYEDVARSGMSPAKHYVLFGAAEGRQPGPDFDTSWYVTNYPDVAETGVNPAVHYLKYGKKEGRATYSIKRG